jgi:phosphatidylethanolamine N-methyltransferase
MNHPVTFAYHLASRVAYVVGVGAALIRQERYHVFTARRGTEAGFRRFRRLAFVLMYNDGLSFVILCALTQNTLITTVPNRLVALGFVIGVVGVITKFWAAARIGRDGFYWRNFFSADPHVPLDPPGPYRYLKNPMYTLGYANVYGLALFCLSSYGLIAALIDHAGIQIFYHYVEKPHFARLTHVDV